ncbi:dTDP-4-dehydrorhamnose reductase [Zeimonas arvi]|uniref:dTDP-4-dehydrorhamnose reductase n=1 Tax=Zeimonas arvi TaxID=2498847 RepID=A0A5C8NYK0_9BURK|nr:dTDP-4-dehydrorhamnose reductase [Zeimonas arvi]TXL66339.1 dTDP-4-dehydrorhamnose reductase [Zeimonas arvi]
MKILLTGATGQVGWELARSLQPLGEVVACDRRRADLSAPASLAALVESVAPQVIVNAAAYTAVDRAEQGPELADTINGAAPAALAAAARRAGALFVHYSTDYVFDGSGDAPRREDAPVAPINAYGRSKLAGEQAIARAGSDWLVLRTSWVYASRGSNFVKTMLRLGAEHESLKVVADQVGAPTSARLIADATAHIVRQALAERAQGRFAPGVLHLCAAGETSWHGFAQEIFDGWRALAGTDSLKVRELAPISSAEYPTPAARPLNSRLDCSRLRERFGILPTHWREGLRLVLEEIAGQR